MKNLVFKLSFDENLPPFLFHKKINLINFLTHKIFLNDPLLHYFNNSTITGKIIETSNLLLINRKQYE
jgi:hypothetical protein